MCVVCTHTFDPSMHPSTSASYTNLISTLLYSILPFNKPKQRKLLLFIAEKKKKNKPSFDTQIKKETKNRAEQNRTEQNRTPSSSKNQSILILFSRTPKENEFSSTTPIS